MDLHTFGPEPTFAEYLGDVRCKHKADIRCECDTVAPRRKRPLASKLVDGAQFIELCTIST